MSKTFRPWTIDQPLLLPPSVQDFVGEDHLARFILALVLEPLDLGEIEAAYASERGQPPFDPAMMTALLLYGYCNGVYSSRRIAKAARERVDFLSIVGLDPPDFRTVSDFRKRHLKALAGLFGQVLKLCEQAGLVKLGHVALDGTKIKANASKHKAMSYERMEKRARTGRRHRHNSSPPCQTAEPDAIYGSTGRALNPADGRFEMASRLLRRQVMTLTDAAAARVRELTEAAGKPVAGLRVGIKNGGCAGMSYTMELAETATPMDEIVEDKGVKLLIDPKAVLFLLGSQMDFKVDRLSASFAFSNPNETSACGCGESVAITPASPEALHEPA